MQITIDEKDAVLILQSIDATDWSYAGESARAEAIKRRIMTADCSNAGKVTSAHPCELAAYIAEEIRARGR